MNNQNKSDKTDQDNSASSANETAVSCVPIQSASAQTVDNQAPKQSHVELPQLGQSMRVTRRLPSTARITPGYDRQLLRQAEEGK